MIKRLVLFAALVVQFSLAFAAAPTVWWPKYGTNIPLITNDPVAACRSISTGIGTFKEVGGINVYCLYSGQTIYYAGQMMCNATTPPDLSKPLSQQCSPPPDKCSVSDMGEMSVTTAWGTGPGAGSGIAKKVIQDGAISSASFCVSSCVVAPSGPPSSCGIDRTPSAGGFYRVSCEIPMKGTGSSCSGQEQPPSGDTGAPAPPPGSNTPGQGKCPAGSVPSGLDSSGMTICAGTSKPPSGPSTSSTTPTTKTTDSSGNTTSTSSTTNSNADGSTTTTTTKTTTAPDGTVTTVVSSDTSKAPSGSDGKADKPEDKSDLCKQHPELTICSNSQVLGSCDQITCTGDAIQCATLRAAATLQCRDKEDREGLAKSTLVSTGDGVLAGNDSARAQGEALWKGSSVDLSNPNLDQSGFLGGGSCFPNKSFTVMGRNVEMNFTTVCTNIQPIRYAMLLIGFILAYMIISKSILQS